MKRPKWLSTPVLAVLPSQILLFIIFIFPIGLLFYLSLTNWTPMWGEWYKASVVGIKNYVDMVHDPRFIYATLRTVGYMVFVRVWSLFLHWRLGGSSCGSKRGGDLSSFCCSQSSFLQWSLDIPSTPYSIPAVRSMEF